MHCGIKVGYEGLNYLSYFTETLDEYKRCIFASKTSAKSIYLFVFPLITVSERIKAFKFTTHLIKKCLLKYYLK